MKTLTRDKWQEFVNQLIAGDESEVVGVKAKGNRFHFGPLEDASELRLDYDVTILPPKKELLPQHEELLSFDISRSFEVKAVKDDNRKILIGVHPYDLRAINMMDQIYLGEHIDEHYRARRENTLIIASDILNVPERAFCASMGTHLIDEGFDLLVTDLGDRVVITEGTNEGRSLLEDHADAEEATAEDEEAVRRLREELPSKYAREVLVDQKEWPSVLEDNYDHPVWGEQARKCLTCGTCTLVCPTCVCYDVDDEVEGMIVDLGGVLASYGATATVLSNGMFTLTREFPGLQSGYATAQTEDDDEAKSNLAVDYILVT